MGSQSYPMARMQQWLQKASQELKDIVLGWMGRKKALTEQESFFHFVATSSSERVWKLWAAICERILPLSQIKNIHKREVTSGLDWGDDSHVMLNGTFVGRIQDLDVMCLKVTNDMREVIAARLRFPSAKRKKMCSVADLKHNGPLPDGSLVCWFVWGTDAIRIPALSTFVQDKKARQEMNPTENLTGHITRSSIKVKQVGVVRGDDVEAVYEPRFPMSPHGAFYMPVRREGHA